jgi:DNA-binding MarR family transcriptional regulator
MADFQKNIAAFFTNIFNNILAFEQKCLVESKNNLTISDIHIIDQIGLNGKKKMTDVADAMGVKPATMSSSADRLEKKGCVRRERSEADRRVVLLSLTRYGRVMCKLHERFHIKMANKVTEDFTEDELKVLAAALSKLGDFFAAENSRR